MFKIKFSLSFYKRTKARQQICYRAFDDLSNKYIRIYAPKYAFNNLLLEAERNLLIALSLI